MSAMLSSLWRWRMSPLVAIFLIVLVDVLGFTIILPLLPFYAERFGASPEVIGLLSASYAVCQLLSGPYLGALSDRMGRKPLLIISQCGTLLGFLILALAPNLWLVFLGRIIDGLTAGNISLAQAYVSDVTPPAGRAKAFGKIGMAFGIGFLLGPALAGFLSQFSYHAPIFAAAGLSATSIIATWALLPQPTSQGEDKTAKLAKARVLDLSLFRHYVKNITLRKRLGQFFLFIFSFSLFTSCFALFAPRQLMIDGRPFGPAEVGYIFSYNGLLSIILQGLFMGKLVDRWGEKRLAFAGFLSMAIGYGILVTAHDLMGVLLAATFSAFGSGVVRPSLTSLITAQVGPREQGRILGVTQSLQSLGQIAAPIVGGFLIERNLLSTWALAAGGTAFVGACLGLWARHRTTNENDGKSIDGA